MYDISYSWQKQDNIPDSVHPKAFRIYALCKISKKSDKVGCRTTARNTKQIKNKKT